MLEPDRDVLHRFGVEVVAELGGRLNQHWLVNRRGESLVLRRWSATPNDLEYEAMLLERVHALKWPVAPMLERCTDAAGRDWSLNTFLVGQPAADKNSPREQRRRGRLLGEFHASLETISNLRQREGWRRGEEILQDVTLEPLLIAHERVDQQEARGLGACGHRGSWGFRAVELAFQGRVAHGHFGF
jgi:aminoglycoside phosphotransferase (APT) family kinase protein